MIRILNCALLVLALSSAPDIARCEDAGDVVSRREVEDVIRRNTQFFMNKDAAALAEEFTSNAIYSATTGEAYRGRDAIRSYYADTMRTLGNYSRDNQAEEINIAGEFAWAIGHGKLRVSTPDGTAELSDHWAAVFTRVEGKWKIRMMTVGEDADILPLKR